MAQICPRNPRPCSPYERWYTVVACTPLRAELQRTGIIRQRLASPLAPVHHPFDLLAASADCSRRIHRRFQFLRGDSEQSAFAL